MKHFTLDQTNDIIHRYLHEKTIIHDIAVRYNVSDGTVNKLLKTNGVEVKRSKLYQCDETFFSSIDSEAKAYFLGLLYADGNVDKKKNVISLSLQQSDKHILETFRQVTKSDTPIKRSYISDGQPQYYLRFYSDRMKVDLINKGCIPKKSLVLTFPSYSQIPEKLIHHFMRGYFDGDGGIKTTHGVPKSFMICGTLDFCRRYQEILVSKCKINETKLARNRNIYVVNYGGTNVMKKIYDFLYLESNIHLFRKQELFIYFLHHERKYKLFNIKNGHTIISDSLSDFSIENNCDISALYKTLSHRRHNHKGWILTEVINPTASLKSIKTPDCESPIP